MKFSITIIFFFALLSPLPSSAQEFYGVFSTDTFPLTNCVIMDAAQRGNVGHMYNDRVSAFTAMNNGYSDFVNNAKKDGFNAIIGFKPNVSSSVSGDMFLVSWWFTGVAVTLKCK